MARPDVRGLLRERFGQHVAPHATRRVVFWHDVEGSFGDLFDEVAREGLGTVRPVACVRAEEGEMFALKRRICRQEPDTDFLVYTRAPLDLSRRGLEGNWLADVELYAEHFEADFASTLVGELGAEDAAVAGIRAHAAFFGAADRRRRFVGLVPHARSGADVALGVLAAALGAREASVEAVVRAFLCAREAGRDPWAELGRYGAQGDLVRLLAARLGFGEADGGAGGAGDGGVAPAPGASVPSDDPTAGDVLAAHVLLAALSAQLPQGLLVGVVPRVGTPQAQACLGVVRAWMDAPGDDAALYAVARRVEARAGLPGRLARMDPSDLADADVFPCVGEVLLAGSASSLADGSDVADEVLSLVRRRRDLRWYGRLRERFDALAAAAGARRFQREHAQGFHCTQATEAWEAYTRDWCRMDTLYREFVVAVDASRRSTADVPSEADDALERLAAWMEGTYARWFLPESNACWVRCAAGALGQTGWVAGVPRQGRFFAERVGAGGGPARKTLVIASDALRYEVAAQLASRLERETKGSVEIASMQATFPSVTMFGMAALLPHRQLSLDAGPAGVAVRADGLPTATTEERQELLRRAVPDGVCVQAAKLINARRSERRALVGDATVVYVFHNQIDATGEGRTTEGRVFEACSGAVDDLVALVRIATNDLHFTRVLVTADHGFIYTREPLAESGRVVLADAGGHVALAGRRYVVCAGAPADTGPYVRVDMSEVGGGSYVGLAPRECVRISRPGPGEGYVHGGVSLQEWCVPVVEYRQRSGGQRGYVERERATLRLVSTSRRVTSMLFSVELLQERPVGGKVVPAEYVLAMLDASGAEVSDVRRAHADLTDAEDTARVVRVQLALKAGVAFDPHAAYELACRDAKTGEVVWREEFRIDIPFAPLDDFGF